MHDQFLLRVALAGWFLTTVSVVELFFRGRASTRWRGSLLIGIAAISGGGFGLVFDLLTSSISPAYFAVGKGLGWADLEDKVRALGLQAGVSVGVVIGCVVSYLAARRSMPFSRALACLIAPVFGAMGLAMVGAGITGFGNWGDFVGPFAEFLYPSQREPFVTVWLMHTGAYLGGACGTGVGLWWGDATRRAAVAPS